MNQLLSSWHQWAAGHQRLLRIGRHTLIWLSAWGLSLLAVLLIVRDKPIINLAMVTLLALSTLGYYYWLGYYIFPKFLYRSRPLWLIGHLLIIYWLSYLLNRAVFIQLQPYSIGATSYLSRMAILVKQGGLFGNFIQIKIALWNYVLGLYLVTLFLLLKAASDLSAYRNQSIRLQRDKLRLERDKLSLERNHLNLELDFLKMQVSPHFLFNTLNTIYAHVVDADQQAADQVLRLAELMRYNLYEANAQRIALTNELNYINDYLQLEQSRHSQRISVSLTADDQVTNYQIAPLLLNTFVENAFKHGVRAGHPAYIQVNAQMEADTLVFTIKNSLQNQLRPSGRKSGGMGLVNVKKRLELLYPNRYQLTVGSVDDQYIATLHLGLERLP